jgi:hypothetical protein
LTTYTCGLGSPARRQHSHSERQVPPWPRGAVLQPRRPESLATETWRRTMMWNALLSLRWFVAGFSLKRCGFVLRVVIIRILVEEVSQWQEFVWAHQ